MSSSWMDYLKLGARTILPVVGAFVLSAWLNGIDRSPPQRVLPPATSEVGQRVYTLPASMSIGELVIIAALVLAAAQVLAFWMGREERLLHRKLAGWRPRKRG